MRQDANALDLLDMLTEDSGRSDAPKSKGRPEVKVKAVSETARNIEQQHKYAGYEYVGGLLYREPRQLRSSGTCGPDNSCKYRYYDKTEILDDFVPLLEKIARERMIFAFDYETGPSKIRDVDPETGEWVGDLDWSTLGNKTGSDPHSSPIFLLSLSIKKGFAHVVDVRQARKYPDFIKALARAVQLGRPIAHNMIFEYMFTKALTGVRTRCYADPMPMTHVLYAGLPDPLMKWVDPSKPPKLKADLASVLQREMGVFMSKKERNLFTLLHPETGLTDAQIAYAAGDTALLIELTEILREKMEDKGLLEIWDKIEAPFLPLIGEQRYWGVPVDLKLILEYRKEAADEIAKLKADWTAKHPLVDHHSPHQLLAFFQEKYPKAEITQVDEKVLSKLFEEDDKTGDFISGDRDAYDILALRGIEKVYGTYLDPWVKSKRHCVTGNIHPDFWQAATATGRLSCSKPNMQNIPSKGKWKKIRHCIVAIDGYLLVDRDLSQFEVRALADMAGEEKMMDYFREADKVEAKILAYWKKEWGVYSEDTLGKWRKEDATLEKLAQQLDALDFHTLNARAIFENQFKNADAEIAKLSELLTRLQAKPKKSEEDEAQIKSVGKQIDSIKGDLKELRKRAKVLTFAIPYGSGPTKIADTFKVDKEKGQELIDKYYDTWPNIARFLTKCRLTAVRKKFTKTPAGRKRFYALGDRFSEDDRRRIRASVERQATNHPIQGINADVIKLASVMMASTLKKYGARILLWVHDETLILCPVEHVEVVHLELDRCLKQAAIDCNMVKCPVKTSLEIGHGWSH